MALIHDGQGRLMCAGLACIGWLWLFHLPYGIAGVGRHAHMNGPLFASKLVHDSSFVVAVECPRDRRLDGWATFWNAKAPCDARVPWWKGLMTFPCSKCHGSYSYSVSVLLQLGGCAGNLMCVDLARRGRLWNCHSHVTL